MSDPRLLDEFSVHADPVWSWAFVAVVTAVLLAILLAVPPDRSRVSPRGRLLLVLLRLGSFLALVACMLRPTIVSTRKARQQGSVLVLADASESMTVADGPNGRTRWREAVEALEAARDAARELTAAGDFDLAVWRFDRDMHRLEPTAADPFPLGEWADAASADETAIGAALDEAVRAAAGRTIAGVVVLSDGAQHAYAPRDTPPQTVARRLGDAGVPLWSITLGTQRAGGQGRDAAVVNLAVAETVYVKNAVEVAARIRCEGLAGRQAKVVLLAEDESGGMREAARTTLAIVGESFEEAVRLSWTPQAVGERKLSLRIEPEEGEVILTNNELSTFIDVVDGGLRVLYLEGALRVEQRFLRRVLSASPDMQVEYEGIDSSRRDQWPLDLGRVVAGDHDVFLIGDLDSAAVRPENLRTIRDKVSAGAGIGFLGGLHAFEAGGWAGSALGQLAPFEADRLARQPFDQPVRESLHVKGPLRMLPDPRFGGISILRQGQTDAESRRVWESLPPLDGATALGRLVPTAKTLAAAADGTPLLVARDFGEGRVLAFAGDSTWRWAMQGAEDAYRRFWRQLVLWLARQDAAEQDSLWIRLAQRRISPGTPLPFDAGATRPDGSALPGAVLDAKLVDPAGRERPVRVGRQGDAFAGVIADCGEPGDWKIVVREIRPGEAAPRERSARFTVFRQDLELANPRANPLLMRQIAEATPGGVRLPEELPAIFAEIAARPPTFESREQWSFAPWDTWPMFLLLAGCLSGEWFLRKRWGLV